VLTCLMATLRSMFLYWPIVFIFAGYVLFVSYFCCLINNIDVRPANSFKANRFESNQTDDKNNQSYVYRDRQSDNILHLLGCNMSSLMQRTDFRTIVSWSLDPLSLHVGNCTLDAIDWNLAKECVARNAPRGLMMIGDSLTRYQYLNLVHFVSNGNWISDPSLPNENEKKHPSWNEFYKVTNERLNGHEICDCFRDGSSLTFENRYFDDGKLRISYLQVFGRDYPIVLHDTKLLNVTSCRSALCNQTLCSPGECSDSVLPVQNLGVLSNSGVYHHIVTSYPASEIVFNTGHWWFDGHTNKILIHVPLIIQEPLLAKKKSSDLRFHWKTTTSRQARDDLPEASEQLVDSGAFFGVFDARSLTAEVAGMPELMWDPLHFEPEVYKGLNQAFLAYICSLPPRQEM
jgi:hypothetical protein